MRPRIPLSLNSAERECVAKWSWGVAIASLLLLILTLALPGGRGDSQTNVAVSDETGFTQLRVP